jgi:hypothetical protein
MAWFRLYFLDWRGRISARDEFEASDDQTAIKIASSLHEACADCSASFEMWEGARRLIPEGQGPATSSRTVSEITLKMQELVLEREELLQQSHWSIARSKRLLARCDQLRNEISRRVNTDRKRLVEAFPEIYAPIRQ